MAYAFVRSITLDHTKCGSGDSTNFPVLVSITAQTWLKTVANGGNIQNTATVNSITVPTDLVFASDQVLSSLLSWEVEFYDAVAGTIIAWVKVATVSSSTDTVFYVGYGDSGVTTFQGGALGAAWDSHYIAIYHFGNGTTLNVKTLPATHVILLR
jgi:hypothetical protein